MNKYITIVDKLIAFIFGNLLVQFVFWVTYLAICFLVLDFVEINWMFYRAFSLGGLGLGIWLMSQTP